MKTLKISDEVVFKYCLKYYLETLAKLDVIEDKKRIKKIMIEMKDLNKKLKEIDSDFSISQILK